MTLLFSDSGQTEAEVSAPSLRGVFVPAIDNPVDADGFGLITPWGGGDTARNYSDYGPEGSNSAEATQLRDLSDYVSVGGSVSYDISGLSGPQGPIGPVGPRGLAGPPGQVVFFPGMFDVSTDLGYFENVLSGINSEVLPYVSSLTLTGGTFTWNETNPAGAGTKNWYNVAMNGDGTVLAAVIPNTAVYVSTDSGANWTSYSFATKNVQYISCNDDGSVIAVAGPYQLWISTDYGVNWTERTPGDAPPATDRYWTGVSVSSTGAKIVIISLVTMFTSTDYGVNWTERDPTGAGVYSWAKVAMNKDGTTILASSWANSDLWLSSDFGATWAEIQPTGGAVASYWTAMSISGDGQTMLVGLYNNNLYKSTDGGTTWAVETIVGSGETWACSAIDYTGTRMMVGLVSTEGRLFKTIDGGANWTETQPAGDASYSWWDIECDSDGSNYITNVLLGRIYIGTTPGSYTTTDWSTTAITSAARSLLDDTTAGAQVVTLGFTETAEDISNHIFGDGTDHTYIDQAVTTVSSPTFVIPTVNDVQLTTNYIGTPTYKTVNDWFKLFNSAGRITGGTITAAIGETVDIASGTGLIRILDDDVSQVKFFNWAASSGVAIPTDTIRFIGVEYNAGSPQIVVKTTDTWNLDTEFPIGEVVNENTNLHILNSPWWISDGLTNVIERLNSFGHAVRDGHVGGLAISVTGTRNIAVTAGTIWTLLNENGISALDTSVTGTFEYYWYNGVAGTWNSSDASQYSVLQWNDISLATLQNLQANRYAVMWLYAEPEDNSIAVLYPQAEYTVLADAEAEQPPTILPIHIEHHGLLLGRVIIKQATDAPISTESAFSTTFVPSIANNHNNLAGLQGGTASEYYHLTSAQYSGLNISNWNTAYSHSQLMSGNPHSVTPTELGLVIGTNVQAWDAQLDDIAALAVTDGNIIVGNGSNWVAESGDTARTSIGLGSANAVSFASVTPTNLGTGYIPYKSAGVLTNSYMWFSGAKFSLGTTQFAPAAMWHVRDTVITDGDSRYVAIYEDETAYAAGVGGGIQFRGKYSAAGAVAGFATINGCKENGTSGNYATCMKFCTRANGGGLTNHLEISSDGGINLYNLKSGATQAGAGASAGELWYTVSHATLPDYVVMMGV